MEEFKYLIPEESIDAIITNVEKLREIENHLRHVFSNHGYNEVLMPSFEYVDYIQNWIVVLLLIRCFNTSITKVKMLPCV